MICAVILFNLSAEAQTQGKQQNSKDTIPCLAVVGKLTNNGRKISGATVQLFRGNQEVEKVVYYPEKEFLFLLEPNSVYTVVIEKEGLVTRSVRFETTIPEEDFHAKKKKRLYYFDFELEMVTENQIESSHSFVDFPIAMIKFDEKRKVFDYSKSYTQHIKKEIGQATAGTK